MVTVASTCNAFFTRNLTVKVPIGFAACKGYRRVSSLQLGVEVRANMVKAVKVYECGGVEKLKYDDVEIGSPQSGCVKIKHTAIGLNFIDTYFRRGQYKTELPFIPGVEGAGTVEEVGPGVTEVNVGDRVCYAGPMGAYAEERLIVADKLLKIPDGVDDISAAAVALKGSTAQVLLFKTYKVEKGQFILIHAAAGGVGSLMVQWATHIGAIVIACVSTKQKAEQAKADGAQHIVLYSDKNLVERVKEITNGAGVSVVYDSVGKDTFQESLECLAIRGSFVSFGQSSGPPDPVPTSALASKSLFLTRPSLFHYTMTRQDLEEIFGAVLANVASGVLKIRVNHTYRLSQVAEAHADIEARKTSGSIVLIPDEVKKV